MRVLAPSLAAVLLVFATGGCTTASSGQPATAAPAEAGRRYTCNVQIEGVVAGGGIKLNGSQVSSFPGWVTVEVDVNGKAIRQYVVSLSTNIIGGDLGAFVMEQGNEVPMKIFYERTGPVASGTAVVQGRD